MSLQLRILLIVVTMLGALLVVAVGAALQFQGLAAQLQSLLDADATTAENRSRTVELVVEEATTAALALGVLAAAVLVFGAWTFRTARRSLFERLTRIDVAVSSIQRGESTRRLGFDGDDELARVARALDSVLDLRDRTEAAMQGRNRELRALLVALLHRGARPAAVVGIDGEIIVSTITPEQEEALRSTAPQLRAAARTLLSRHFVSAAELATDVRIDATHVVRIQALALGPQRIVGWLAVFETPGPSVPAGSGESTQTAS